MSGQVPQIAAGPACDRPSIPGTGQKRAFPGWARAWLSLALCLGFCAWIHWGSLNAPLVSEDGAALGYVHRQPLLSDWNSAQYDLRTVRFWRPWMTASLDLQEAWTGTDPAALRSFNWFCAGLTLLGLLAALRRAGVGVLGCLLAGLFWATFPYQGGTVTWIVGRVDCLCLPALAWAAWAGAAGRPWILCLCVLWAFGTKESGLIAVPLAGALALASGWSPRQTLGLLLPASRLLVGLLICRWVFLGTWMGGYLAAPRVSPLAWLDSLPSLVQADPWASGLLVLAPLLGWFCCRNLGALWASLVAGLGLLLLLPMLAGGPLGLEHRRWWAVPELAVSLGLGLALAPGRGALAGRATGPGGPAAGAPGPALSPALDRIRLSLALVLSLAILWRAGLARADVQVWAQAGQAAQGQVDRLRASLQGLASSDLPVLVSDVPHLTDDGRAYVLHFGLADRLRPPFEKAPRPVWPWRLLFADDPLWRRDALGASLAAAAFLTPGEGTQSTPLLPLSLRLGAQPVSEFEIRPDLASSVPMHAGPEIWCPAPPAGGRLEALLATELGYCVAVLSSPTWVLPEGVQMPAVAPTGSIHAEIGLGWSLRDILAASGQVRLVDALAQAADFGASSAFLELRQVDGAGQVLAVSPWVKLYWSPKLRDALLPKHP